MNKIDRRIAYRVVLDTETCPLDKELNEVVPTNMWTYDCGWAVVDKRGKVYKVRSFVNADIFLGEKDLMQSAYYANKIPQYWEDIKSGKRVLTSFHNIRQTLLADIAEFEVKEIECLGKEFDPTYHQGVSTVKDDTKESGIILEVFQKGYMYKDKVIRPSMVKVNE